MTADHSCVVVVVPTRNRSALLQGCLSSIARAVSHVPGARIVVVDDGSTDDTPEVVSRAVREGIVALGLRNEQSRGPAAARNRGWRALPSSLVAFTDDDCEVDPSWLRRMVDRLDAEPDDVAAVGGGVLPSSERLVAAYMTLHRILEPPASLSYVVTANCAFRRAALEHVGGFDEAVRAPGGEDPGLCLALRRHGYRFAFEPAARVRHRYREGLGEFLRTFYRYGKGCRIVMDP